MAPAVCCTCATLLSSNSPPYNEKSEKPPAWDRKLDCCSRIICARCLVQNPRFTTYCPFCQISIAPTALPPAGLREPPAYCSRPVSPVAASLEDEEMNQGNGEKPPSYTSIAPGQHQVPHDTSSKTSPDVVHYLRPPETIPSLSLLYRVPPQILRAHNSLFTDSLLAARKTIFIPGTHYHGASLSSTPVLSEEEEEKQRNIRRWMMGTKCAEYEVAVLYLKQSKWDLRAALEGWSADERWERENPMNERKGERSGKLGKKAGIGLTGQLMR